MDAIQQIYRIDELDLANRVKSFLAGRHFGPLRSLRVEVLGDTVLLAGTVSSFHERQVALECCKRVAGVRHVVDEVVVASLPVRIDPARFPPRRYP